MDRQVDRRDRAEVTRLSVQTVALQAAAVEGKGGAPCSRAAVREGECQ